MVFRNTILNVAKSFVTNMLRRTALCSRSSSLTKWFLLLTIFGSSTLFFYYISSSSTIPVKVKSPSIVVNCNAELFNRDSHENNHINEEYQQWLGSKVLLITEYPYSNLVKQLVIILESVRIKLKIAALSKNLPSLSHKDKGTYSVILFEKLEYYLNLDSSNRQLLDKYCIKYGAGIIGFAHPEQDLMNAQVKGFPLYINTNMILSNYQVNPASPVLRITKPGSVVFDTLVSTARWSVFYSNHSTYEPVSTSTLAEDFMLEGCLFETCNFAPIVMDKGNVDGIQKIFFGLGFQFWLHKLLFLDSLSFLSRGKFSFPLERYIMVDIDDIFVGKQNTRMTRYDVHALIESQKRIRKVVRDFKFNLGFSGKFYRHGTDEENKGDEALIENRKEFWWFGHSWSHSQAHMLNISMLIDDMELNKAFSKLYSIPVNLSYAVAPHHSGVFPVHEELYDAWKRVWNIKVTSTEEYPNLWPARHRRGFIYKDIKVLPRQTCGLYTHTIFFDRYPGGIEKLDASIKGGELFQTVLYNLVNIFMTHLSNYGNDRLGLYTFENLFNFIQCWTNLKLKTVEPMKVADLYFEKYNDEVDPLWRNPCAIKRHLAIWSEQKSCNRLPSVIIIGPQKAGSTALFTFMGLHPSLVSSFSSPTTFEEVQFFVDKNYLKGVDWYMQQFPLLENTSGAVLFEKSANYFSENMAPLRIFSLLPNAKIICIIINPSIRAYSWYQHILSHGDEVAKQHTFHEVITANSSTSRELIDFSHRCLTPGLYVHHIERWLKNFSPAQLMIVDGEQLKLDPVRVMEDVQDFLQVERRIDYSTLIKYSPKKGFFCPVSGNKTKCLGSGKGRKYSPMDSSSKRFLSEYYRRPNMALYKFLKKSDYNIPRWLIRELNYHAR